MTDMLLTKISQLLKMKGRAVIAIDGMAAAGKSTMAKELAENFKGQVIYMDHFFLPAELRTEERLEEAGGNVHYERFATEVAEALNEGTPVDYGIFDCSEMKITHSCHIENKGLIIVEGAYSLRPEFRPLYDLKVFMEVSPQLQMERILKRNGPMKAKVFEEKWIPLEKRYFKELKVRDAADILL